MIIWQVWKRPKQNTSTTSRWNESQRLFIQYTPQKCFSSFTDKVTTSRRAADANLSTKILADTNKLIGNSAYGVVLMRTDKHRRIKYLTESTKLAAEFNKSSFTRFEMFDDNLFEVQHAKSRVVHGLPLQICFFYSAVC